MSGKAGVPPWSRPGVGMHLGGPAHCEQHSGRASPSLSSFRWPSSAPPAAYPAIMFHLSLFYSPRNLGLAYTIVATATAVAGITGGPLAAGGHLQHDIRAGPLLPPLFSLSLLPACCRYPHFPPAWLPPASLRCHAMAPAGRPSSPCPCRHHVAGWCGRPARLAVALPAGRCGAPAAGRGTALLAARQPADRPIPVA